MAPMFVFNRVMATALDTAIPKQRIVTVPPDAHVSSTYFHQQPFLFHTACNHMHQNGLYEIPIFEDSSKTAFLSNAWLQDSQQAWQPKAVFAFLFLLGFMHREQAQSMLVGPHHTAFPIPLTLKAFNTLQGYSECLRRAWSQLMRALHGNTHAIGYSKHLHYKHKYSTRSQKKRHFKSSLKHTQQTGSAPVRLKLMELIPDHTASLPRAPRVPLQLHTVLFPPPNSLRELDCTYTRDLLLSIRARPAELKNSGGTNGLLPPPMDGLPGAPHIRTISLTDSAFSGNEASTQGTKQVGVATQFVNRSFKRAFRRRLYRQWRSSTRTPNTAGRPDTSRRSEVPSLKALTRLHVKRNTSSLFHQFLLSPPTLHTAPSQAILAN